MFRFGAFVVGTFLICFATYGLLTGQIYVPDFSRYGRRRLDPPYFAEGEQLIWVFLTYASLSLAAFALAAPMKLPKSKWHSCPQARAKAKEEIKAKIRRAPKFIAFYIAIGFACIFAITSVLFR